MEHRSRPLTQTGTQAGHARRRRRGRRQRLWVRVETDVESYVGCLLVARCRGGLDGVLNDDRAYLALWNATLAGSASTEEFVALHKGAIRSVVELGPSRPRAESSSGR